ncbi:MAG TPA: helix-turn-helix domain-containing protein, partial [Segetibacter sp.]
MDKVSYENIGMFAAIPHSFIKESKKLKFHSRWLYVALVYYRNSKNGKSFPSYDTIQQSTGLRREMIAKCLNELEESGWIKPRKKRYGNSNVYEVV